MSFNVPVRSVAQVNEYLSRILEEDVYLNGIFVEGEISNFKHHSSGHLYFTLKDARAAISAVMFRGDAAELAFVPCDGAKVVAYGRVSVYEKTGQVQFYTEMMEPVGRGSLYTAFEQLKARLDKEGLFDPGHKQSIPDNAKSIAVITSPTGAAVRDIVSVAKRRNRTVKLTILPVMVQGEGAAAEIANAIDLANREQFGFELIIVGRGGGSVEDLWAFNEEIVARAIYKSKLPVISAVGHETDFTIADFVADLRAPTPSAASELAVADAEVLYRELCGAVMVLNNVFNGRYNQYIKNLNSYMQVLAPQRLVELLHSRGGELCEITERLHKSIDKAMEDRRRRLDYAASGLDKLSPLKVLSRGYAVVEREQGGAISSVRDTEIGGRLSVRLSDGRLGAEVYEIIESENMNADGKEKTDI